MESTLICEEPAPVGTVAVIVVSLTTEKLAFVIPKPTWDAPVKPDPVIVTEVPGAPLSGVKLITVVGARAYLPVPNRSFGVSS